MDRNSLIAIGLIIVIIFGYSWYTQPTKAELDRKQKISDSMRRVDDSLKKVKVIAKAATNDSSKTEEKDTALLNKQLGGFSKAMEGTDSTVVLKNSHLTININQKGGSISSVQLNKFVRPDKSPLYLLEKGKNNFGFQFLTKEVLFNSKDFYWKPSLVSDSLVVMKLEYADGKYIEQRYKLNPESYLVDYNIHFVGLNGVVSESKSDIELTWNAQLPMQEKHKSIEQNSATVYYKNPGNSPDNITATSYDQNQFNSKTEWISLKWQYFNAALIHKGDGFETGGYIKTTQNNDFKMLKNAESQLYLAFNQGADETHKMQFYFGPNHYQTLKKLDIDLHRIIPLGWGIFGWVNRFVVIPVFNFLDDYIGNYGIIILLLTLFIKLLLLPLVYRSYISTAKMRILKPELDAIKAKFGGDMQKIQQENLAMYRKAGVNPLSGCMPLLLQMPILLALFQFFPASFELRQKSFLWATDLSRYDSVLDFGFNIPMYGDHISLFTVLMTISTLIYTRMNNQLTGVTGQMKWISYLMPIMFLGFFNNYASGLTYYYFLANMVTFGQQAIFRKLVDEKKLHAQINANKSKAGSKPKSNFQKRMEDYAKKRGVDPKKFKR